MDAVVTSMRSNGRSCGSKVRRKFEKAEPTNAGNFQRGAHPEIRCTDAAEDARRQGWKTRPIAITWDGVSERVAGVLYFKWNFGGSRQRQGAGLSRGCFRNIPAPGVTRHAYRRGNNAMPPSGTALWPRLTAWPKRPPMPDRMGRRERHGKRCRGRETRMGSGRPR